jgi:hypothetical protein
MSGVGEVWVLRMPSQALGMHMHLSFAPACVRVAWLDVWQSWQPVRFLVARCSAGAAPGDCPYLRILRVPIPFPGLGRQFAARLQDGAAHDLLRQAAEALVLDLSCTAGHSCLMSIPVHMTCKLSC